MYCLVAGGVDEGVRIIGSGGCSRAEGRVEVYNAANDVWGTVCADRWSTNEARVVCNQLGLTTGNAGRAHGLSFLHSGTEPMLLYDVYCDGTEDDLLACQSSEYRTIINCLEYLDAGVLCEETGTDEPSSSEDIKFL